MTTTKETLRKNIRAFERVEEHLLRSAKGEYALLFNGEVIATYPSKEAARAAADKQFPEGGFAISPEIGAPPERLGSIGFQATPASL